MPLTLCLPTSSAMVAVLHAGAERRGQDPGAVDGQKDDGLVRVLGGRTQRHGPSAVNGASFLSARKNLRFRVSQGQQQRVCRLLRWKKKSSASA